MRRRADPWDRFYRQHEAPWRGERPVAELLPLLGGGPVLELGCGNGKLLRPLQKAGVDVVGLDVSWNALSRLAGSRVMAHAAWLPFRDECFSAVLDFHCTGHLTQAERYRAAKDIHRVLAPRGHFITERLGRDDLRAGQGRETGPWTRTLKDGRRTHFSDEASLLAEFQGAGLHCLSVRTQRRQPRLRGMPVTRSVVHGVFRASP